jgi:pimeloyl-ACP methyl ester carboxylesterase
VALDCRGYNLSDKPKGAENYQMRVLIGDVLAAVKHFGERDAIIMGHDWGGAIAWATAIFMPKLVQRLIVLNIHHPKMMLRELSCNPAQRKASEYAQNFKKPGAHLAVSVADLCRWVSDQSERETYAKAFAQSDIECMLAYYSNFPNQPYEQQQTRPLPKVKCPVLHIFGMQDQYVLSPGLSGTAEEIEAEYTLVTLPNAGHFVQHDAPNAVTRTISNWLDSH